jgi:hypothetical protein
MCIVSCLSASSACVCGQGAATWGCPRLCCSPCHLDSPTQLYLLAILTLPPSSTAPAVAGCRLVGCSVVSGLPLQSGDVSGVLQRAPPQRDCVCLGPVLSSRAPSPPAAAAAAWRERGLVPIVGWSYGGVELERGLWGGGRRGWCAEWARRG